MNNDDRTICFLQISDLHITDHLDDKGKNISSSRIIQNKNYIDSFISTVQSQLKRLNAKLSRIFICGDLANSGDDSEYTNVNSFLKNIMTNFHLSPSSFIIVPGNHDINWLDLILHCKKKPHPSGQPNQYHDVKFQKFKMFYNEFYKDYIKSVPLFEPANAVVRLDFDRKLKIAILALNSNYQESHMDLDHMGSIDEDSLRSFLAKYRRKLSSYYKIAIVHHNPTERILGSTAINNWDTVERLLQDFGISTYFYGHTHNDDSSAQISDIESRFVGVGSFAKNDVNIRNSFNLIIQTEYTNEKLVFEQHLFRFETINSAPYWQYQSEGAYKKDIILLRPIKEIHKKKALPDIPISIPMIPQKLDSPPKIDLVGKETDQTSEVDAISLVQLVKENALYKSGHFHWSPESRSHGWIDTAILLGKNKFQETILQSLLHCFDIHTINQDLLIGIGIQGNILGSKVATALDCRYSYLPDVNKKEYNDYENKINCRDVKSITLLTDVVFSGNSIKYLITKRQDVFDQINTINCVALFYTGNSIAISSLSTQNIHFFAVCERLRISPCPFKEPESCAVWKEDLEPIYKLY